MAFNPNEPRDPNGMWTKVPGYIQDKISTNSDIEEKQAIQQFLKAEDIPDTEVSLSEDEALTAMRNADYDGKFTPEQTKAIKDYSNDYSLNRGLRGSYELTPEQKTQIKNMDEFLANAPKYDGVSYRAIRFNGEGKKYSEFAKNLQVGNVISDRGFMSTSATLKAFDRFGGYNDSKDPAVFMSIKGKNGVYIQEFSGSPSEREVLYPRDTKLKINSISDLSQNGRPILLLKLEEL